MKLIKKFTEGKYSGYQIKQMISGSFSVYYGKELIKKDIKTIDDCYHAIRISEVRFSILEQNMIQCAIQAYRETECKTECEDCEMINIFKKNLFFLLK